MLQTYALDNICLLEWFELSQIEKNLWCQTSGNRISPLMPYFWSNFEYCQVTLFYNFILESIWLEGLFKNCIAMISFFQSVGFQITLLSIHSLHSANHISEVCGTFAAYFCNPLHFFAFNDHRVNNINIYASPFYNIVMLWSVQLRIASLL